MTKKIKVKIFKELRVALQDALAYERGKPVKLRVTAFQISRAKGE